MRREYSDAELRWAAWKHRIGYGWGEIAKALVLPAGGLCRKVQRSGYAYELPKPKPIPADCLDWVGLGTVSGRVQPHPDCTGLRKV